MGNAFTRDPATDNTNYGDPYTGGGAYTPGRDSGSGASADDWFTTNAPPPPATNGTPGHTNLSPQEYVTAWRQQHPNLPLNQANSQAAWDQLIKDMRAVGFTNVSLDSRPDGMHKGIHLNGSGTTNDFVKLTDGSDRAIWLVGGDAPGGGSFGNFANGQFATPWSGSFPTFSKAPAFTPTTGADVFADPGYKFRLGEGEKALQQSAAARGLLNTGGTAKDLIGYGQSFASNEFNNVDLRRRGDYTLNYGTQTIDPYQNAYKNAMDSYNVWRNQQNDVWGRIVQAGTA